MQWITAQKGTWCVNRDKKCLYEKEDVFVCRHAGGQHSVLCRGAAVMAWSIMWVLTVVTHVHTVRQRREELRLFLSAERSEAWHRASGIYLNTCWTFRCMTQCIRNIFQPKFDAKEMKFLACLYLRHTAHVFLCICFNEGKGGTESFFIWTLGRSGFTFGPVWPRSKGACTRWFRGFVRAPDFVRVGKLRNFLFCREWNHDFSGVQPVTTSVVSRLLEGHVQAWPRDEKRRDIQTLLVGVDQLLPVIAKIRVRWSSADRHVMTWRR
jgi:hypothetical protein